MRWTLDTSHAEVEFAVKHLMISTVKGRFRSFTGTGLTNPDGTLRSVEMSIDAASLDTNVPQRDDHLRSADFFDVANHPQLTFRSSTIQPSGNEVNIAGDLTIRGTTRPVTLKGEFTPASRDPWGNPRSALAVSGKINRKDFGLTWNQLLEAGGVAVGDEVRLRIEVEAVAAAEAELAGTGAVAAGVAN
jgi:polyisoprenoid-binding protein YceI